MRCDETCPYFLRYVGTARCMYGTYGRYVASVMDGHDYEELAIVEGEECAAVSLDVPLDAPSLPRTPWCSVCGRTTRIEMHHVIPRSRGGKDGPQVPLCSDCHGRHHRVKHLTFRYEDERWSVLTDVGWQPLVEATGMEGA